MTVYNPWSYPAVGLELRWMPAGLLCRPGRCAERPSLSLLTEDCQSSRRSIRPDVDCLLLAASIEFERQPGPVVWQPGLHGPGAVVV